MNQWVSSIKSLQSFKLYWQLTYCNFYNYLICFHFCSHFFSWYSYRYHERIGLKMCAITGGMTKCKSIIQKKKRRHDKIVLLANSKLSSVEVLISKDLNDANVSHDESFLINNNVLKEFYNMKKKIKNFNNK